MYNINSVDYRFTEENKKCGPFGKSRVLRPGKTNLPTSLQLLSIVVRCFRQVPVYIVGRKQETNEYVGTLLVFCVNKRRM